MYQTFLFLLSVSRPEVGDLPEEQGAPGVQEGFIGPRPSYIKLGPAHTAGPREGAQTEYKIGVVASPEDADHQLPLLCFTRVCR